MDPTVEVSPPLPDGVASPPPAVFSFILWTGAFACVLWGMRVLFGLGRRGAAPDGPVVLGSAPFGRAEREPAEDPTLEAPGPER